MQHNIFVGIQLESSAKKHIARRIAHLEGLPVKWIDPVNYHIILASLGYVEDADVVDICQAVSRACESIEMFDVDLDTIAVGPGPEDPKMLWITGEPSESLRQLEENIEKELGIFVEPKKAFRPHIILGRIRKHRWEELEDTPHIQESVHIPVSVGAVTVFENIQENKKRKFVSIDTLPLL